LKMTGKIERWVVQTARTIVGIEGIDLEALVTPAGVLMLSNGEFAIGFAAHHWEMYRGWPTYKDWPKGGTGCVHTPAGITFSFMDEKND
jgi:hypothetical protein